MKLKYELAVMDIDGDSVGVPVDAGNDFRGVIRMNGTAARIIELLKDDTTEEEIVEAVFREYDASRELIRDNVQKILATLRENDLIVE